MRILIVALVFIRVSAYIFNVKFGNPFKIEKREIKEKLSCASLSLKEKNILKELKGFYGLIGSDVSDVDNDSMYDLFTGDGMVQGVFIDNGELTFVKHFVRTDKLVYEEDNGKMPRNSPFFFIYNLMSQMKLLPNMMGLANTALININSKIYALFERDVPYRIDIDFDNKEIKTLAKQNIPNLEHFSAHSKYNGKFIETIDCDVINNKVYYYQLNEDFTTHKKIEIKTKYVPFIHDFYGTNDTLVLIDSPFVYDYKNLFTKKIPIYFDNTKNTFIHIVNKTDSSIKTYSSNESFYFFHYASYNEKKDVIEIYASLYNKLDFTKLDVNGTFHKITINKKTREVSFEKNNEMEKYNLDFPVKNEKKIIFTNANPLNKSINGFIICENLKLKKKILFENRVVCGEPSIANIKNTPYLVSLMREKDKNYFTLINMNNYNRIDVPIKTKIENGFHSIFIKY